MNEREVARLEVFRRYHAYVLALHGSSLARDVPDVQRARSALARAIEEACLIDPYLLTDFKRAFGSRQRP